MPHRLLFTLISLWLVTGIHAENEFPDWFYRAWQTEQGLPDNSVTGVAQSSDGYLWVATKSGALRFDGTDFDPLPLRELLDLPSRSVRHMFMDRFEQLWLAMERGPVIRVDKHSFRAFTQEDGIPDRVVRSMTDDPEGQLWIAFPNGIYQIRSGNVTQFGKEHGIPSTDNPYLACDATGQVWLASDGKLGRLSNRGFELVRDFGTVVLRIAASNDSGLWITAGRELMRLGSGDQIQSIQTLPLMTDVTTIFEDRDDALWIGTHGLGLYHFKNGSLHTVPTSFNWVECITQDRDGNIWAGTSGGGLNLIKPRTVELFEKGDEIPFTSVRSVTCEPSGRLWVTSQAGHLAYHEAGQWHPYNSEIEDNLAMCAAAGPKGDVWIGIRAPKVFQLRDGMITKYQNRDGISGKNVRSLLATKNGDVWIATDSPYNLYRLRNYKISVYNYTGSLQAVRAMAEGADGTVWIGTSEGRLVRVEGEKLVDVDAVEKMPSIRTLHATDDGSLWIGYAGDGLGHLKNGRYTRFTTKDGLFDNYISQIQDDGLGSLWITANRGLFKVSLKDLLKSERPGTFRINCRVFGQNDGIPSFQPGHNYTPDSCRSPDGRLYFATSNGLLEANPKAFRDGTQAPPLALKRVTLDGELKGIYRARSMIPPNQDMDLVDLSLPNPKIILPPGHDRLAINFAALSLGSPENVEIRYRLKPVDTEWAVSDSKSNLTFTRLPAGKYEFQLTARNNEGVWNEAGTTLNLVVTPFYWETWWFKIGGGVLTVLATAGLVFMNLRRKHRNQLQRIAAKRALEQERTRIARDIHDDLGASLTQISLLSQSSSSEESKPVLDQIQSTARHLMRSMDEVVWAVNPEHDTFDDLASYLSGYAQEFLSVAGIRCRLQLPMDLPEHSLSSQLRHNLFLAFKEALHNAVKYAKATEVRISINIEDDSFTLKVADDGGGIDVNATANPARPTGGKGLHNMTSRMAEIGGTCTISSSEDGTTVEFKIPFRPRT